MPVQSSRKPIHTYKNMQCVHTHIASHAVGSPPAVVCFLPNQSWYNTVQVCVLLCYH